MAKFRNKTDQTLETRLGSSRFTTEPDAVIEVDDALAEQYDWPESTWTEVDVSKSRTRKKTDDADSGDDSKE